MLSQVNSQVGSVCVINGQNTNNSFMGMLGQCTEMQRVFELVRKVSRSNSTVLILGESGTGKELIAKALHRLSGRSGKLVPVNCGAIPEEILESELFGHEKGSFTGAISSRIGRFQIADGGTIFLDEIGEMSPKLQVKLLRVLQERKIEPVGSSRSIDVNVRVIAATNKDLREEVKAGRFREDLYYRLQVVPIELPALRQRANDVVILSEYFLEKSAQESGKAKLNLSQEALTKFLTYSWPGNIRELENLLERLTLLVEGEHIELSDLPSYMRKETEGVNQQLEMISSDYEIPSVGLDFNQLVNSFETKLITMALTRTNGNKKAAARLLNLNRTTLVEKIKKKALVGFSHEQEGDEDKRYVDQATNSNQTTSPELQLEALCA